MAAWGRIATLPKPAANVGGWRKPAVLAVSALSPPVQEPDANGANTLADPALANWIKSSQLDESLVILVHHDLLGMDHKGSEAGVVVRIVEIMSVI